MAVQWIRVCQPPTELCLAGVCNQVIVRPPPYTAAYFRYVTKNGSSLKLRASALNRGGKSSGGGGGGGGGGGTGSNGSNQKGTSFTPSSVPNSNYVVPLDKSSSIIRPLDEILRDLNKRIPDTIIKSSPDPNHGTFIPWYQANRMLSFYAPGWCGEIRDVIFSDNGSVTVVYRVTIRGSDGEAHREATGTVAPASGRGVDPVAAAEEMAFCRACARFGLGLYLYHDE